MDAHQLDAERAGYLQAPIYDNAPARAPTSNASFAADYRPWFRPGSIVVYYKEDYAAFLPTDLVPKHLLDICWSAENLPFQTSIDKTQKQLGIILTNSSQLMTDIGQPKMMPIKTGGDWRLAMQMCHDQGLTQCVFRVLGEEVAVEPVAGDVAVVPEVPERGQGGAVAAVGVVGLVVAAGYAAVQMGFFPF